MTTEETRGEAPVLPAWSAAVSDVARGARGGWRFRRVFLAWLAVLAVYWLPGLPAGGVWDFFGGRAALFFLGAMRWGLVALAAVVVIGVVGMIAGTAGWEYGRSNRWTLAQCFSLLKSRCLSLYPALLSVLIIPLFLWGIVALGAAGLAWIPKVGPWLAAVGIVIPGLLLLGLGAAFLCFALPASLLLIPAAALDFPDVFDTVSRSISFVRERPLRFFVLTVTGFFASVVVAAVSATFVFIVACMAILSFQIGVRGEGGLLASTRNVVRTSLVVTDLGWPSDYRRRTLSVDAAAADDAAPEQPLAASLKRIPWILSAVLSALGRLAAASFLAAFITTISRTYLLLRWQIDGDPPSALVRYDESFSWS